MLEPGIPESFNVLVKELQALGLDVELLDTHKKENSDQNELLSEMGDSNQLADSSKTE
jgi:hypothetical protein